MRDESFKLEFDADARNISTARLFASAIARQYGLDADVVQDLKIAISEVCTNAVQAHARSSANEPVRLHVSAADGRLDVKVVDAGGGFPALVRPEDSGGLGVGLHIIRSLFPGAEVGPNDVGGTTVRFSLPR